MFNGFNRQINHAENVINYLVKLITFLKHKPKKLLSLQAKFEENIKDLVLGGLKNDTVSHSQPLQLAKIL